MDEVQKPSNPEYEMLSHYILYNTHVIIYVQIYCVATVVNKRRKWETILMNKFEDISIDQP
jgi:hypothetical protein